MLRAAALTLAFLVGEKELVRATFESIGPWNRQLQHQQQKTGSELTGWHLGPTMTTQSGLRSPTGGRPSYSGVGVAAIAVDPSLGAESGSRGEGSCAAAVRPIW